MSVKMDVEVRLQNLTKKKTVSNRSFGATAQEKG